MYLSQHKNIYYFLSVFKHHLLTLRITIQFQYIISTSTPVIFMITFSSLSLFGVMLVWMNSLVTSITMIYFPFYAYIVFVRKIVSSYVVVLELSYLDNHSLVGFPLNTILSLSFFVLFFSIIIIFSWALLISYVFNYLIYIGSKQVLV